MILFAKNVVQISIIINFRTVNKERVQVAILSMHWVLLLLNTLKQILLKRWTSLTKIGTSYFLDNNSELLKGYFWKVLIFYKYKVLSIQRINFSENLKALTFNIVVPDHYGGRPMEVNACFLNSYMVYL
jgi:hypothetical protein